MIENLVLQASSSTSEDVHRRRGRLESLFCYDKPIPEEKIEKPVGLSLAEKIIGDNPRCPDCQSKGAVLCSTCSGSGLYVDSILESQGIIVKVRCLGILMHSSSEIILEIYSYIHICNHSLHSIWSPILTIMMLIDLKA